MMNKRQIFVIYSDSVLHDNLYEKKVKKATFYFAVIGIRVTPSIHTPTQRYFLSLCLSSLRVADRTV
jgi:hypothetical protein